MKKLLLAGVAALALAAPAGAAEMEPVDGSPVGMWLTGEILLTDVAPFWNYVTSHPEVTIVRLNSPGGQVGAGAQIGDIIRSRGMSTIVGNGDECVSACVLVFASGAYRGHWTTASIGVHSAAEYDGTETDTSMSATVWMARKLKEYGMPDAVIGKLTTTRNQDVTWLTSDDLGDFSTVLDGDKKVASNTTTITTPTYTYPTYDPPKTDSGAMTMVCVSHDTGHTYPVQLWTDIVQLNNQRYPVTKYKLSTSKTSGRQAWVFSGKTRYGHYTAVYGGVSPRIEYNDGKRKVRDLCGQLN